MLQENMNGVSYQTQKELPQFIKQEFVPKHEYINYDKEVWYEQFKILQKPLLQ